MSVRLKRAAKALRARLGLAEGVREAKPGDLCEAEVTVKVKIGNSDEALVEAKCGAPAHVVGFCKEHLERERRPRRR